MEEKRSKRNEMNVKKYMFYIFGLVMIVIYVGVAYLLLFSSLFQERVPTVMRYIMGGVFLLYGVYRAYRQIKGR